MKTQRNIQVRFDRQVIIAAMCVLCGVCTYSQDATIVPSNVIEFVSKHDPNYEIQTGSAIPPGIRRSITNVPGAECEQIVWTDRVSESPGKRSTCFLAVAGKLMGTFHRAAHGPVFDPAPERGEYEFALHRDVADISPLRGLHIRHVSLYGAQQLKDIGPLEGMGLHSLKLDMTGVRDISPLKGMPLRLLQLEDTRIGDLSPIRGCPIESLYLDRSPITDLSPLRGIPLVHLSFISSGVTNLTPLQDSPLEYLDLAGSPGIRDLSPLQGLPLKKLDIRGSAVTDLSPLAETEIWYLHISVCKGVRDLSPLKNLNLRVLRMTGTPVTDLRPLATHPLETICISPSHIREGMDILRGMKTLRNIGTDKAMYKVESFWRVYDRGDFTNQGDNK